MTEKKKYKRRVRALANEQGMRYTQALTQIASLPKAGEEEDVLRARQILAQSPPLWETREEDVNWIESAEYRLSPDNPPFLRLRRDYDDELEDREAVKRRNFGPFNYNGDTVTWCTDWTNKGLINPINPERNPPVPEWPTWTEVAEALLNLRGANGVIAASAPVAAKLGVEAIKVPWREIYVFRPEGLCMVFLWGFNRKDPKVPAPAHERELDSQLLSSQDFQVVVRKITAAESQSKSWKPTEVVGRVKDRVQGRVQEDWFPAETSTPDGWTGLRLLKQTRNATLNAKKFAELEDAWAKEFDIPLHREFDLEGASLEDLAEQLSWFEYFDFLPQMRDSVSNLEWLQRHRPDLTEEDLEQVFGMVQAAQETWERETQGKEVKLVFDGWDCVLDVEDKG